MNVPRISASSYSNTAPLIWSFLYGSMHGRVEIILDNAPARSAELLAQARVDAALVPVIAYQMLPDVRLVPGVCVGAKEKVRSVALITRGMDLQDVRSVSLDTSSKTSVVLTKILFREFLGFEPEWRDAAPDLEAMLDVSDCALLIGDPALSIAGGGQRNAFSNPKSKIQNLKSYDLAQLWRQHTGLGFIFAMWMTRAEKSPLDFAAARDEGITRIDEIVSNYLPDIKISTEDFRTYLTKNISYKIDEELERGMKLYFDLANKHRLCEKIRELAYAE
ncbi:MAG: menaquinone biosynthesis protein [Pyrinomonadaceae bacterium]